MQIARVMGEVVATTHHRDLDGRKLLLVQPENPDGSARGGRVIAVDASQAGVGDRVLVADEGNAAAQVLERGRGAIRTVIVGIIDDVAGG
ncbi:MAG: EutN/CcmL family microcompartment protein [Candidatus Eisenbacteria bacterium]|uniref:EutN/CcmL family microcompartment protein n=1 Tax=Eiseniibacteriota bacterium TaxID=2212470 RepID=A0A849SRU0_UNCEI|nr:EutN/CcmL family microcompartment protein [Candidatus Eisenbacteria bacterium]